jgi:DNA invertase Pin-like site-specific DNA recombinase|tara:strand:+ start:1579 stop:2343 length:765 start_codon:yes stop_codon:yes gene_type:complete
MSIFKTTEGKEHTGLYVGYLRVSTEDQDCTRQTHTIKKYLNGGKHTLKFFTEEPMSGATDPYKREELMKAVDYCRKHKATLVFADLERLCRKMWMTLRFLDEVIKQNKINFIVCNDPTISEDPMRLQMKAMFSEWERQRISERTKETLDSYQAQIKEKGYFTSKDGKKIRRLGVHSLMDKARQKSGEVASAEADRFAKSIYYYLNDAYTQCSSLNEMSIFLNDRKVKTPRGGSWYPSSVKNMLKRLKIGKYDDS